MKYRLTHITHYEYNDSVSLCHNEAHLVPRPTPFQTVVYNQLNISPLPSLQQDRVDFFGNPTTYFSIQFPHKQLSVTSESEVYLQEIWYDVEKSPGWEQVRMILNSDSTNPNLLDARQFIFDSPFVAVTEKLRAYALPSFQPGRSILEATNDLMNRVFTEFVYDPHFTTIVTPLEDVLEHKRGVCQDFAHLMIGCIRSMGLAARYVSGYLETLPPPGQQKLQGSDASHAWLAVFVPELGWVDFDPTNNKIPYNQHITTAWGRDYSDVTPLKGIIFGGGDNILSVSVDVLRID
jgi:transglutaminase-like putative cysteine protease